MVKKLLGLTGILALSGVGLYYIAVMLPYYAMAVYTQANELANQRYQKVVQDFIRPILPTTSAPNLYAKINQYRISQGLGVLKEEPEVCVGLDQEATCVNCSMVSIVTIEKYATTNQILVSLLNEEVVFKTITGVDLTHLCISEKEAILKLVFAKKTQANVSVKPIVRTPQPSQKPTHFTETQLWEALRTYRQAQNRGMITQDENLCVYARKRVQDHLVMRQEKTEAEYPNPDKYPLDAHAGFAEDAESGYAFEVTKVSQLAENLAYWPSAEAAVHIIEWGWDSSTEGHREAQLGEWDKGCLSGAEGFYVAIFGK